MAHSVALLSWSVLEYKHKYIAIKEYEHVCEIIRWGANYLMDAFGSSNGTVKHIYTEVGGQNIKGDKKYDNNCWERPEDVDYIRRAILSDSAPETAAEMAAALAAASLVFANERNYSRNLVEGAISLFNFAMDSGRHGSVTTEDPLYRSSGFHDEYLWASSMLYYATGNSSYLSLATDAEIAKTAGAFRRSSNLRAMSWDNKLPGVALLMMRLLVFINPGFPAEEMLRVYYEVSTVNACAYLRQYDVFRYTPGGMIILNPGNHSHLPYVVNAVFVASLFADYLRAENVPGWYCGPQYISREDLLYFARSQMQYLLGANPSNYSFIVGYGARFPLHVHHRGASIPADGNKYNCSTGRIWLSSSHRNPHNITGAMVGGPDSEDRFRDIRDFPDYTEPTLVGNAALVAALVSMTTSGGLGVDINSIFQNMPPLYPADPAPPAPWRPDI